MAMYGSIPAWAGKPGYCPGCRCTQTVYPRVGGETAWPPSGTVDIAGLSPRGRGNRVLARARPPVKGSIPAWAGKPAKWTTWNTICWVYPRVGGETDGV